jgi:predicted Zn-dependent protease
MREARLLSHEGREVEAVAVLAEGRRCYPGLVLSLTEARLALERNDPKAAIAALDVLRAQSGFRPEDWPLAREGAELLAHHGAADAALGVYVTLARTPAPTLEARQELLVEARAMAEATGDEARTREFENLLKELSGVP